MKTAIIALSSCSAMTQSRKHDTPKTSDREGAADYEARTWINKAHFTADDRVFIPAFALKCSTVAAARYTGDTIPGKGKSTWTKKLQSGLLIPDDAVTNRKRADIVAVTINANADGVRGSGKRVSRTFPTLTQWEAKVTVYVLDDIITKDVLQKYFTYAGQFIGVGQYRPENGGTNGRFKATVESFAEMS
jgi:hypothetical protein